MNQIYRLSLGGFDTPRYNMVGNFGALCIETFEKANMEIKLIHTG